MTTVTVTRPTRGIAQLTLDRPDRLNALSHELVGDLHTALDVLATDRDCRAIVLTGAGRGFCAGFDLIDAGTPPHAEGLDRVSYGMVEQQHIATLITHLRRLPQPVIAAVNGPAAGGGLALALGSDIRIASPSATFTVANVKVGLSGCDIGISYLLPRAIGSTRAFEMMLTGRTVDADEADRVGLVSRVVASDALLPHALELATTIASHSRFGIWMTKEVMWSNLEITSLQAAIDLEDRTQILGTMTGAMEEAKAAFREGRSPRFTT
ncbi:MAG: enoyl-CoA hydratase/isomerase family protein [Actinobacteria bacterium]|nr:enoyl-CoA hydratase/isomerase family protein [Actinomycetota bacterium]